MSRAVTRARTMKRWADLARAAEYPAYGRARRAREELRSFVHAQLAKEAGAQQPLKLGNRGWWLE